MKKWCGPLQIVGEFTLSRKEIEELTRRQTRVKRELWISGFLIFFWALPFPYSVASWKDSLTFLNSDIATSLSILFGSVLCIVWFAIRYGHLKTINAALSDPLIEEYSGPVTRETFLGTLEKLRNNKNFKLDSEAPQSIRILASTGQVISVNGIPTTNARIVVNTHYLATEEAEPYAVDLNIQEWIENAKANGTFERRHLTLEEKKEISGRIEQYKWFIIKGWIPAAAMIALEFYRINYFIVAVLILYLPILSWMSYTWLLVLMALKQDLEEGDVYILGENSLENGNPRLEFLLHSGQTWTIGGRPGDLRHFDIDDPDQH